MLPNSSPALEENTKSGFARLAENLREVERLLFEEDLASPGPSEAVGELINRCELVAGGIPPRSDEAERRHRETTDYGMRMARQRNDLLAVLFSSEGERRKMFEWLCEHSDVPELYRNDYARA